MPAHRPPRRLRLLPPVLLAVGFALTAASCSAGGEDDAGAAAPSPTSTVPVVPTPGAGASTRLGPVQVGLPDGWEVVDDLPDGPAGPTYAARGAFVDGVAPSVAVVHDEAPVRRTASEEAEALMTLGSAPGGAGSDASSTQVSWPGADDAWFVVGETTVSGSDLRVETLLLDVGDGLVGVTASSSAAEDDSPAHAVLASAELG